MNTEPVSTGQQNNSNAMTCENQVDCVGRGEGNAGVKRAESEKRVKSVGPMTETLAAGQDENPADSASQGAPEDDLFGRSEGPDTGGQHQQEEDEESEVAPKKVSRDPGLPTQSERDDHCIDHTPYRSWCEDCVRGRGLGEQHRMGKGKRGVPVLSFDYLFITRGQLLRRGELEQEEEDGALLKILVAKDSESKAVFAHVVDKKGVDSSGYAVTRLVEDIRWLGHTRIALKADNERAIVKLLKEALKAAKTDIAELEQVTEEFPSAYDSQSNGDIENAIRNFQGLMRTMKLGLERRLNVSVPTTHPLMSWLAEHTAWTMSTRHKGADGKTAYERVRGMSFGRRLLEFGEKILYKLPTKGPRHDAAGKLAARWEYGLFLGFSRISNDYVIWTKEGAVKARGQQRLASDRRWPPGELESVSKGAHSGYAPRTPERFLPGEEATEQPTAEKRAGQSVQIRQSDWLAHGSTPGCSKCIHAQTWGWGKMGGPHSPECVERFRKLFLETESGQERVRRADQRQLPRPHEGGDMAEQAPPPEQSEQPEQPEEVPEPFGPISESEDDMQEHKEDQSMEPEEPAVSGDAPMDHGDVDTISPVMAVMADDKDLEREVKKRWTEILKLVDSTGGCAKAYAREAKSQIRKMIAEVYSPPRVTAAAKLLPGLGITAGFALDLTRLQEDGTPWDFDVEANRQKALDMVLQEKPMMLVGSPMCTAFCAWQKLNAHKRDPKVVQEEWQRAMVHLRFVCKLYAIQVAAGRYFLHEHPTGASSWKELCILDILGLPGVQRVNGDQCQYGQETDAGNPVKKPTGWMSNAEEVLKMLSLRCTARQGECSRRQGGKHEACSGRTAKKAAIYPFELCRAILQGFRNQLRKIGLMEVGVAGMQVMQELHAVAGEEEEEEEPEAAQGGQDSRRRRGGLDFGVLRMEEVLAAANHQGRPSPRDRWSKPKEPLPKKVIRDAITGQELQPELVEKARQKELEYFKSKNVWTLKSRAECLRRTGKRPITVKWVDVNKGDDEVVNYRSRLVAREIRLPGEDPIFAPTPPLESVRMVLSLAATDLRGERKHVRDPQSEDRTQVSIIDISRAYFNAKKSEDDDPTYVELPDEDPNKALGMCGLLKVHMYGTRAAADGWHNEYSSFMQSIGFEMGDASACVFRHKEKGLTSSVHGDDFTTAGPKRHLDWLKQEMQRKYELTENYRLGPGGKDQKEGKVLNRIVRWTDWGVEYEADPRQGEKFMASLGLEGPGVKSVSTPGVKVGKEALDTDKPLPERKHTLFRAVAARGNYLGPDRPEIQFSAKEICRWMSAPTELGVAALKRLGRYLVGHQRLVFEYPWQEASGFDIYSDTDWAGCLKTRKSTSGGCLMLGKHLLKSWSATQGLVSLSSGEAEFYGVTKAAGIAIGMKSLMEDLGASLSVRVWTDSSATVGICGRQGLGKLRHIDTRSLWVQQRLRSGGLELRKVRGEVNPADLFTKHLTSGERIGDLLRLLGCRFSEGRAAEAPLLRKGHGNQEELLATEAQTQANGQTVQRDGYTYPATEWDGELVPEAYLHDGSVLPHEIEHFERLFPRVTAADELEETRQPPDWLESRGLSEAGAAPAALEALYCADLRDTSPADGSAAAYRHRSEEECREVVLAKGCYLDVPGTFGHKTY